LPSLRLVATRTLFCVILAFPAIGEIAHAAENPQTVVIVSADAEWKVVRKIFPKATYLPQTYGEYFAFDPHTLVVQGGWGKVSAAASVQYAIDRWRPKNIVNLGTCGGIAGRIERNTIVAVTKTIVYDIVEQMGDADEAVRFYSTSIDLGWVGDPPPSPVARLPLLSADRDLVAREIPALVSKYDARVVDWESGAIAWTASRNHKRVLILRGVTDLVGAQTGGEAYGNEELWEQATNRVMKSLFDALPAWLAKMEAELH
jgi:adenosylhomocysteine nucleosidase